MREFSERILIASHQLDNKTKKTSALYFLATVFYSISASEANNISAQLEQEYTDWSKKINFRNTGVYLLNLLSQLNIPNLCLEEVEYSQQSYNLKDRMLTQPLTAQTAKSITIALPHNLNNPHWLYYADKELYQALDVIPQHSQNEEEVVVSASFFSTPEYLNGQKMHEKLKALQKATTLLTISKRQELYELISQRTAAFTQRIEQLEPAILDLATRQLDIHDAVGSAAQQISPITLNYLQKLYFHNDLERYQQATHLAENDIQFLHQMLAELVRNQLEIQYNDRCLSLLDELQHSIPEYEATLILKLHRN